MSSQLKEFKAKALAEKKRIDKNEGNVDSIFFKQLKEVSLHPKIIKQARQTGQLNLSNRGIAELPDIIWNITTLTAEETKSLSLSLNSTEEDHWWEYVDLTKLILASNVLKSISPEISNYKALNVLDLHDNSLSSLPDTLNELKSLSKLNLSRNQFEDIPECVFQLKNLKSLLVQHNKLRVLNDDIGNLSFLEELDLSNNSLKKLPHCIGFLSRVTYFNLSNNELVSLPIEIGDLAALKQLDVSKNKLKKLPTSLEMLHHLEQLYVQHNNIAEIPFLTNCIALKEIHAGFNNIHSLSPEFLETISGIKLLDFRDNKINNLPENISSLLSLERLDVSNNDLSNLPYTLGTLPHLKFLAIEGNPMRSIRRDIIQRGTVQLLRWLRSRIEDPSSIQNKHLSTSETDGIASNLMGSNIDKHALKSTKSLLLSNKNMNTLPRDIIENANEADVTIIDISKNLISTLPEDMCSILPKLSELHIGYNKLSNLPSFIGIGEKLQYLDLRNNQLQNLPCEISNLSNLREINLSFNRFQALPTSLYNLKKLEIILASDNQIETIEVSGLESLPMLAVLDLHNNSIKVVPPELGNLTKLRSLLLDGNLFRNPRPAILSKGTPALLEFLRSRIPQN